MSISDVGVLTPVTVAPHEDGNRWHLVAGHRRTAAAEQIGLETVPALVLEAGDALERLLAALVENLERRDLDPVEEAGGYRRLVDAGGSAWSAAKARRSTTAVRGRTVPTAGRPWHNRRYAGVEFVGNRAASTVDSPLGRNRVQTRT